MKKFLFMGLALATALACAPAAMATGSPTPDFYFTLSGTDTGSGTLSGVSEGSGKYYITGGNITIDGQSATIIPDVPADTVTFNDTNIVFDGVTYDNVITSPGTPSIDSDGLLFKLSSGEVVNLWYSGGYFSNEVLVPGPSASWVINPDEGAGGGEDSFSITPTPEPSSWMLLGTGLFLMAGFVFMKTKSNALMPSKIHTA